MSAAVGYGRGVPTIRSIRVPAGHTPKGGVLVGSPTARHRLVQFEDPQCPCCYRFEKTSDQLLHRMARDGLVAVEYRMRCFLGPESVRACNALAAATESGRFDPLRRELFASQPPEQAGGYTSDDLIELGRLVGLGDHYEQAVREGRYEHWVVRRELILEVEDPDGTPAAVLDGQALDPEILFEEDALRAVLMEGV